MKHRAKRLYPGRYLYRGRYIVQTSWDGARGGLKWRWELAIMDRGVICIDGDHRYMTLREAKGAVDAELDGK